MPLDPVGNQQFHTAILFLFRKGNQNLMLMRYTHLRAEDLVGKLG
jgi:hypothetical protein